MFQPVRLVSAAVLASAALFAGAAGAVDPLVKPVAPGGGAVRVRLPMIGKTATSAFKAQIPKPKGGASEVTVYVSMYSGVTTTIQQWKAWGFDVPANRNAVLPELIISGVDAAPKAGKGRDVEFKLAKIPVSLYEAPGGDKGGISDTLSIPLSLLVAAGASPADTRVHFADRLIEFSAKSASAKKLGTGAEKLADLDLTDDSKLLVAHIPTNAFGGLAFAAVNGKTQYKRPTGKVENVTAGIDLNGGGILMSVSMARGCGVELDSEKNPRVGVVKELRFGPIAGAGVKGLPKDFVLRDVKVDISDGEDHSHIWLSSEFVEKYFKDGVLAQDGNAWKLHGRVKPEFFDDQKNRPK